MRSRFELVFVLGLSLTVSWSARAEPAPRAALAQALGRLRWGMTREQVQRELRRTPGHKLLQDDHNALPIRAGTARLVARDALSRMIYVFHGGALRQIYKLFEALAFPEGNFRAFAGQLTRRFGEGEPRAGVLSGEFRRWVEWRDHTTVLRAVDETDHRGFYCLMFEARR